MKAVLCKAFGPPESLVVEDLPSPTPEAGQVIVSVHAASVNFPDLLVIQDKYQFKPSLPFSPGGEVSGIVTSVGAGVTSLAVGDRVVAWAPYGCFAEEVALGEGQVIKVPDGIDPVTASTLLVAYGTTHHALVDRAALRAGETLVVLGAAGGVGVAAIEIGKLLGARVIACASSDDKLEVCRARGADEVVNYSREDLKARLKALAPNGADVVYDPVGGSFAEPALRAMAWRGRYLVVGFAAGDIPKIPLNLTLLKGCSIVGVFWGSFTMREPERYREGLAELFGWVRDGRIRPHVDKTYPLEQASAALSAMAERRVKGKVVLVTERGAASAR
ncbi:NADPH:quinone oxidoreductase family protein [Polyangium mundeleinium]|uniref:NADPH:quinone oxidoreductase family protein n=1 Tax=Polyangium mundeleinium TaxID=2995306 RepID=A0ABT5ENC0_9BACT|nr:NADPH:quinone oxidoreductase family protein [Polyangium mundeleinium]MDC0743241.1 NADPH:quinone oxidoreductase family protein [Polyangium mundeleinium]